MKKSKFSESQVVKILGEVGAGKSVREVCTAHGLSEVTFSSWKRKYSGMEKDDVKRLRDLEAENAALKRIVADQALVIDATGKLLRKNGFRPPNDGRGIDRGPGRPLLHDDERDGPDVYVGGLEGESEPGGGGVRADAVRDLGSGDEGRRHAGVAAGAGSVPVQLDER
jgi:putative transposase